MDAYIIIEEVPYRLNVVSGNIALLPIAVELSKASALGKKNTRQSVHNLAFVSLYFRNYFLQAEAWRVY